MDNVNMHQGLSHLAAVAKENHRRLERIISHIIGPRPSNENKSVPPSSPGLLGHLENLAAASTDSAQALSQLEAVLGVDHAQKDMASINSVGSASAGPSNGLVPRMR